MSVNKPQNKSQNQANTLFICPLLSANSEYNKMCVQDRCAWFIKSARTCSAAIMAHESIMRIKKLQEETLKTKSQTQQ